MTYVLWGIATLFFFASFGTDGKQSDTCLMAAGLFAIAARMG